MSETLIFPLEHERCFSYETNTEICDKIFPLLEDSEILSIIEHKDICITECSFENKTLYSCSKTEEERDNELNGLRNNRVYFTYKYFLEREDGYVPKTYGPGAYFLERISPYVKDCNPFIHSLLYTSTQNLRIHELTVNEYNRITIELWCYCTKKHINVSSTILFAAYLKHIKNIDVLKITGSDYEYPIIIFL